MKYPLIVLMLFSTLLGYAPQSLGKLIDSEIFKEEFGDYEDYAIYKEFNESHNIDDYTFCEFDRGEELCLIGLKAQKYAVDFKNFDARRIIWEEDSQGISKPVRLENLDRMEYEILVFFAVYVDQSITELKNSTLTFQPESKSLQLRRSQLDGTLNSQSSSIANGCGTPNHGSYPYIPDYPFLRACNNHDICYASFRNKSWCDSMFLTDMRWLAQYEARIIAIDFPVPESIAFGQLMAIAYSYHAAVAYTDIGLDAYCANKGTSCKDKKGELNVVSGTGSTNSGSGDGGSGEIFPLELYNGGICLMPVQYRICAYGVCIRGLTHVPCP
ncbi:hypothetical protein [Glaciecola sp. KUL10]|uniref:hypothetical protein n=1 Tax=Glaciecola sp. (strain KUL10) TaxID=2161813 RepID=UPI000D7875DD|nr:hypothetical protein [Glaciecola sp. KUL10]GBL05201.1 hypothetical protein KUL10_25210 [Glaciecola sp. KUL10]